MQARDIIDNLTNAGFYAVWEWTGGNCRAIGVARSALEYHGEKLHGAPEGRHILITGEYDPFTDDDFDETVDVVAIGHYIGADDVELAMVATEDAAATVAAMLSN